MVLQERREDTRDAMRQLAAALNATYAPDAPDAHRVAAIADEELAAWDAFLQSIKR